MPKSKPVPFVDPPRTCRCGYCTDAKVREFIDGGLNAAREQGLPKPMARTVDDCVRAEFGTGRSTVHNWLKCCKAWTDPWPGESGG